MSNQKYKVHSKFNRKNLQEKSGDEVPPPLPTTPPPAEELAVPAVTVQPATPVAAPAIEKIVQKAEEVVTPAVTTEIKEIVVCPLNSKLEREINEQICVFRSNPLQSLWKKFWFRSQPRNPRRSLKRRRRRSLLPPNPLRLNLW